MKRTITIIAAITVFPLNTYAQEQVLADMSDPLAVYNRMGAGITNNGLNLKFGLEYETPDDNKQSMHVFEVKGVAGEALGWSEHDKRDDSIDSVRYRNFLLNKQENRGTQIDIDWNFDNDIGSASYSFLQGTPKLGMFQFYPLAGVGVTVSDDKEEGINIPGGFALIGVYAKATLSDNVWVNYNPMYKIGIGGQMSDWDQIDHEVSVSYKIDPRKNVRFYANWNDETRFEDGDFRVEFNYQF